MTISARPLVREVVDMLATVPDLVTHASVPTDVAGTRLTAVAVDQAAAIGAASWISHRVFANAPERIGSFRGSLLVVPNDAAADGASFAVVKTSNPKHAFTLLLGRFFPDLIEVRWPVTGQVAEGSTVDASATIAPGALIGSGCRIGPRSVIGPNSVVANTTIGADVTVGANCTIGLPGFGYERDPQGAFARFPHVGRVEIGDAVEIGSNSCIDRGTLGATRIGTNVKIDNLVHVAHNVVIGENSLIIAHAMLGGSVTIGHDAWCAPSVSILNKVTIGANSTLGMGAVVLRDVPAGQTVVGNPARLLEKRQK